LNLFIYNKICTYIFFLNQQVYARQTSLMKSNAVGGGQPRLPALLTYSLRERVQMHDTVENVNNDMLLQAEAYLMTYNVLRLVWLLQIFDIFLS
jgi:hypothetical protein